MEWFPDLHFGWCNGWISIALLGLADGISFLVFPREVVSRLFDRSGWNHRQVIFTVIGKCFGLGCLFLLVFSPLKVGRGVFYAGTAVSLLSLAGLVKALFDFRSTPPGELVRRGIYRFSRHPQIVMSNLVLLGGCLAVGSWAAVLLMIAARGFGHFGILAEEEVCLAQFGEEYRAYTQRVPRYFLIF